MVKPPGSSKYMPCVRGSLLLIGSIGAHPFLRAKRDRQRALAERALRFPAACAALRLRAAASRLRLIDGTARESFLALIAAMYLRKRALTCGVIMFSAPLS
jgi:hypothetical protein